MAWPLSPRVAAGFLVALGLVVPTAGCSAGGRHGSASSTSLPACGDPPSTVPAPVLPDGLPAPAGASFTEATTSPTERVAAGFVNARLAAVADSYQALIHRTMVDARVTSRTGDRVTIALSGPSSKGDVVLTQECESRVVFRIVLRPTTG